MIVVFYFTYNLTSLFSSLLLNPFASKATIEIKIIERERERERKRERESVCVREGERNKEKKTK
jgi:hypothetical protein